MKLSEDLTAEDKDTFVELLYQGADPSVAAHEIGSTGVQFKHCYSPRSQYYDEDFALRVAQAKASTERVEGRIDKLDGYIWAAAENREKWAIEKLLLIYHPDFEPLRHQNLRISGSVEYTARLLFPALTREEIIARLEERGFTLEEIEQRLEQAKHRPPAGLLPAKT